MRLLVSAKPRSIFPRITLPSMRGVLILALAQAVLSQTTVAANAEGSGLEEVIVTAQRRTERLENVPMSVAVVSAETMAKAGAVTLHDLMQVTAGLVMNLNGTNTQPSLRGVSYAASGSFGENNVALYIDGLYQGDAIGINSDFANIADVQVLKGPQGTLYGRNATGGAILINTKAPSKTFTGTAEASYAEYNEKFFGGYVSGPITDYIRYSLAAQSRSGPGYIKYSDPVTGGPTNRSVEPFRQQNVQVKLEADVTDDLTATLGYTYNLSDDGKGLLFTPLAYVAPTVPAPPLRSPSPDLKSQNYKSVALDFAHSVLFKLSWRTGIGTLTSTAGYDNRRLKGAFDFDGTYVNQLYIPYLIPSETYQENLNYQITTIKNLDLVVGGSYYHDRRDVPRSWVLAGGVNTSYSYNTALKRAYQFYVDGTYHLTDQLSLTAGGGYAHEYSSIYYAFQTPAANAAGTFSVGPINKATTFKKFSPRASLRYEFMPQTDVYFSYSEGFKAGLWQQSIPPAAPVRQETIKAFELGFKMARPKFRFEAAGFYYDYKDLQVSANVIDPLCQTPPNCTIRILVVNGPKSHIYGADSQFIWTPVDRLNLRIGGAYVHARFLSFPNASGTGLNAATNTNVAGQVQDWSGQQLPRAPSFTGNVSADYDILTSYGDFLIAANASFTTSYVVGNGSLYGPLAGALANKQRYRQGGYALLNTQVTWTDPSGHYSLGVFVRNLTDKKYWLNYQGSAPGDYGTYAPPRVFGGRVKATF